MEPLVDSLFSENDPFGYKAFYSLYAPYASHQKDAIKKKTILIGEQVFGQSLTDEELRRRLATDIDFQKKFRDGLEKFAAGKTLIEADTLMMRENSPKISPEEGERFFQKIRRARRTVIYKGNLSTDRLFTNKAIWNGDVYTLDFPNCLGYSFIEDLANDLEKLDANFLTFGFAAETPDGNRTSFSINSEIDYLLKVDLIGVKPEDPKLIYWVDSKNPITDMTIYEKKLIDSFLNLLTK
ncbi:MAG: hypothetical protein M1514_03720 [Patescibacteria group bacterium]|nr:hypothetical protein [Patescibacteria group bacterium]